MAAVLKKRALAEFSQLIQESSTHAPLKKLKLIKKPVQTVSNSSLSLINTLADSKSSVDTLRILLQVTDSDLDPSDVPEAVKVLIEQFRKELESSVRVKILSLLCDIGSEHNSEASVIIDETIALLRNDMSHKVIAQGMNSILKLGKWASDNHQKFVQIAKFYLRDISHMVKCRCLEVIGMYSSIGSKDEMEKLTHLVSSYFMHEDARVRSQAFSTMITMHKRGFMMNPKNYVDVCAGLNDDYEIVRIVALELIWIISKNYPDNEVLVPDSHTQIRLIDDAFGKISNSVTDSSMNVRTLAAKLLGSMKNVSPKFLFQTLDKKLMSNMRRKRTAHELAWENVTSGEWSSGKKWANDNPRELLKAESISLMSSGACGAFVHGLEDEFLEVRTATVESLSQLSCNNAHFSNLSLDFLVDMFNDEIEAVRLEAIDCLRLISQHIILRDDQLETILGALDDFSQEVRESLHRMLATCRISTISGLNTCVDKLLENLKKYPQDKRSIYKCLQRIGSQHPELVLPLVPTFLSKHPFFDLAEPDVEGPQYICVLILVLNAAEHSLTILPLLEPHTLKHYLYLRDTMTQYVPKLSLLHSNYNTVSRPMSVPESLKFLNNIINNLDISESSVRVHTNLLQTAREHLDRLSGMDSTVAGTAQFTALYIAAQLQFAQILENGFWSKPGNLATQQVNNLKTNIENLLQLCLKLQFFFVGLDPVEQCAVKQFRLRALALNLVYIVKGSNSSALAPCHHFLTVVEDMQKELNQAGLQPDNFTTQVFSELMQLEEPKPGTVSRILIPILSEAKLGKIPKSNINIRMSSAVILEPTGQTDTSLKFTAGLIMSVPFEAELHHLIDPSRIRLKIKYPDQRTQIILPRLKHLKPLYYDTTNKESLIGHNVRLLTSVLISHQVWSEACDVEVNVALAIPEADIGKRKTVADSNPTLLDLCKPVKVSVAPKPIKKTLL